MNICKRKNRFLERGRLNVRPNVRPNVGHIVLHFVWLLLFLGTSLHPIQSQANPQGNSLNNAEDKLKNSAQRSAETEQATWLVFGDSLSAAYGMDEAQGWVALLAQKLAKKSSNVQVINASISGETSSGGKQRLPALMQQHRPQLLVLELGANDALRGQNMRATQQNLQQMIDLCVEANNECRVILLGVRLPTNYGPAYDQLFQTMYQALADANPVLFDAFFLETVVEDPDFVQADGLHPNATAQPVILKRVWPLFEQWLIESEPKSALKEIGVSLTR